MPDPIAKPTVIEKNGAGSGSIETDQDRLFARAINRVKIKPVAYLCVLIFLLIVDLAFHNLTLTTAIIEAIISFVLLPIFDYLWNRSHDPKFHRQAE